MFLIGAVAAPWAIAVDLLPERDMLLSPETGLDARDFLVYLFAVLAVLLAMVRLLSYVNGPSIHTEAIDCKYG